MNFLNYDKMISLRMRAEAGDRLLHFVVTDNKIRVNTGTQTVEFDEDEFAQLSYEEIFQRLNADLH